MTYSSTPTQLRSMKQHLKIIFDSLRKNYLYLKWSKCNLYAKEIDLPWPYYK